MADLVAAQGLSVGAACTRRRTEAQAAQAGRLRAALERVIHLEAQLAALVVAAGFPSHPDAPRELLTRLRLIAPVFAACLRGEVPPQLAVSRRNTASQDFVTPAAVIATASQRLLNTLQRGKCGRRAAQAVHDEAVILPFAQTLNVCDIVGE